jgi:hypothetical protein
MPQGDEGAVGGQGGGNVGEQPAQNTPTGAAPTGTGAGGGTGGQGTPEQQRQAAEFRYKEDRSNWIPPHRLTEESTKRQTLEQQLAQHKADLEREQKRVRALSGLEPKAEGEQEAEELREAFKRIRPDLAKLDDKTVDRMLSMLDRFESIQQSDEHRWIMHADQMLTTAHEQVAEALGAAKLTERQQKLVNLAYTNACESDKEFLNGHLRGNKAQVEKFVKELLEDWGVPSRRSATAAAAGQRRAVPSGRGTAPITSSKPKVDYNNEKAVEDAMVAAFVEHGGKFGG